jgi:uncharacterized membrane protein (DUF485 family)
LINASLATKIKNDKDYIYLVQTRRAYSIKLTLLMLCVYFSFILTLAFYPTFLAAPLYEGATTTIGIAVGIFIILFSFSLTGIYVRRANSEFDTLTQKIHEKFSPKELYPQKKLRS